MTKIALVEAPEWHYVTHGTIDIYEPDITDVDVECALCKTGIGWTEHLDEGPHGEELEGHRWVEYYEVANEYLSGEPDVPSKFCEDCMGWIGEVGPDVRLYKLREDTEIAARSRALMERNLQGKGLSR